MLKLHSLLAMLAMATSTLAGNDINCTKATACLPDVCQEPDCFCFETEPAIPLEKRPMIVYLTFDDALSSILESNFFSKLFYGQYKNPNGCPIRGTFFVTHLYNDYALSHKHYTLGNDIAIHSITHRNDLSYWAKMNESGWVAEVGDMRRMISKYANIPIENIQGMRGPFLQGGGDTQFSMMEQEGLKYDCTMPSIQHGYVNLDNGVWPHTMHFAKDAECQIQPCPSCAFPIWNQPILDLEDLRIGGNPAHPENGAPCAMLDSCVIPDDLGQDPDLVFQMMRTNFDRAYKGNTRAPLGFYLHAAWFLGQDWKFEGYKRFLAYATTFDDVWFVPIRDGIRYRESPMSNEQLINNEFEPFNCDHLPKEEDCKKNNCRYEDVVNEDLDMDEVYMSICGSCPQNFPWLNNWEGF